MSKFHIWAGNFKSKKSFRQYLDQKSYLKAWDVYNNEPPTGNEEEDAEPDPALRCDFCKEVNLDTYDEDFMIIKYYSKAVDIDTIAEDTLTDADELKKLWKKHKLKDVNAVIVYEDDDLSTKSAAKSTGLKYLGKVTNTSESEDETGVHYLWVGEKETLSKKFIKHIADEEKLLELLIKEMRIEDEEEADINFYYNPKKEKLDEMLINQVEDYNIAEKMILKADEMKVTTTANCILDISMDASVLIDETRIAAALGMKYIGRFTAK
ncbi:Immunity protein 22 [Chitinophaga terrae (ex Kim and Jung 2007)]|uniref:Immunity protein 22 n=1 Tax=Chitinophaga terrae (ex Kim and Jung 2007) TaxID=408074 RepID=A0A1H4BS99_9BACT|nr:immunity 22 family protein [Chitinophaga terrae (ex Kim and Jung 2007)]GEP89745.1 hypothetical protein CTE07_13900 [Chitinophaga terrae (ex Kim and Jung 2007)]SEA50979.1 Immunity protein 22 [Chitinophaga terrae (ex Kim and Jung 2007)]